MVPEQGPPRHRRAPILDRPFQSGDRRDPLDDDPSESFTGASTPAVRVQWPHRIGTVPPLAAARQERDADERLVELVASGTTAVVCQVLSGMGGVGKTQLAADYARRLWDQGELDLLMWVNASSRESVADAFAQAGMAICGAEGDQAASAFLNWLDRAHAPRSLIVLDDLSDPDHLQGLWPPAQPEGRTIITTRRRDAAMDGEGRVRVDVDLFTAEEAVGYLHRRLGARARRTQGAAELAERLGRLPLALSQAAAFILDQPGLTCQDYLRLIEDRTVALAELSPDAAPDDVVCEVALQLAADDRPTGSRIRPESEIHGLAGVARRSSESSGCGFRFV